MAVHSIAVPPDPRRDARAAALVDSVGSWPLFVLRQPYGAFPAGTVFRRGPSSRGDGTTYKVNAVACECLDYQQAGNICKHVRAVVLWEQKVAAEAAGITRVLGPAPKASYADLFPACRDCGDELADGLDGRFSKCASDLEWQQRRDARAS